MENDNFAVKGSFWLVEPPDAHKNDGDGASLCLVAKRGLLEEVRFLVKEKRADVEVKTSLGRTPLMEAAAKGHLPVVKYLVQEAGADITERDSERGDMAIHLATYFGYQEVVEYFLQLKPSLLEDPRNDDNDAPIHRSAFNGQWLIVKFLVEKMQAKVDLPGFFGRTPLLQAAVGGHVQVVMFLVRDANANLYARDATANGDMAVHLAAFYGHKEVVDYLIGFKKDLLFEKNNYGDTALNVAASSGHLQVVEMLVANKRADKETIGFLGRTPLMQAAQKGYVKIVKYLLEKADANVLAADDDQGAMAIHLAAECGHLEVVKYLLSRNNKDLEHYRDKQGSSPLAYAKRGQGKNRVIALLESRTGLK